MTIEAIAKMALQTRSPQNVTSPLPPVTIAAVAIGIFLADQITPPDYAFTALYAAVVLGATRFYRAGRLVLVAAGCAALTLLCSLVGSENIFTALCSIAAIAATTLLALYGQAAEATLREQASLLDFTHDPIFVRDLDDVITYWNHGAEQLYGWTREEAVGKVVHQLLQTIFPVPLEDIKAEVLRGGRWEGELIHTKRVGTEIIVSSRWSLQRDTQGRPAIFLETNNDITERKRAELLTAKVFECAPDGICIIGRDCRYQRVNPGFARNWGMPAERIVGMHVSELLGTERFEQSIKPELDRCFAGEEVTFAAWFIAPCGRFYQGITYSPLRLKSGQVEAVLVVSRDLTELMLSADALRVAQAELAHVNRITTTGQMAASIAHEVTQPVSAIIMNANTGLRWLGAQPPDLEEIRQSLARVARDGTRAMEVIGRVRALARNEPPRQDRLDINEVIREIIDLTCAEWQRNSIKVRDRLSDDLPLVLGDRVQLQQVILNLIVNAIEAMSGVSDRPRELMIVSYEDEPGNVLVEVKDTGPGFKGEDLDRLFQSFYTTKPGGVGLGLAVCHSIVATHGGRLWAAPNTPHGAVFRFILPIEAKASEGRELSLS